MPGRRAARGRAGFRPEHIPPHSSGGGSGPRWRPRSLPRPGAGQGRRPLTLSGAMAAPVLRQRAGASAVAGAATAGATPEQTRSTPG